MNRYAHDALPWLFLAGIAAVISASAFQTTNARDEAMRARGRAEEIQRLRVLAEDRAEAATKRADSLEAVALVSRAEAQAVAAAAGIRAQAANRRAAGAEAELRATLEAAGQSTALVDTMRAAHADELAAKDEVIASLNRELVSVWSYAEGLDEALTEEQAARAAVEAERDAYKKEADAWAKAANPSWLKKLGTELGRAALYGGGGYLAGKLPT